MRLAEGVSGYVPVIITMIAGTRGSHPAGKRSIPHEDRAVWHDAVFTGAVGASSLLKK